VPPPFLLTLSARSASSLDTLARRFAEVLEQPEAPDPATLCHAAAAGRSHHALRLAALGAESAELAQRLRASADGGDVASVLRGRSSRRPTVAFLFTGQGAQYLAWVAHSRGPTRSSAPRWSAVPD
jgi:acyl transferase domain-containing protein